MKKLLVGVCSRGFTKANIHERSLACSGFAPVTPANVKSKLGSEGYYEPT